MKVIIVGGVAGGASCAARLRRLDEQVEILMVERGPYVSYANCGLPYHVGGVIEHESSLLVANERVFREQFAVDCRTGCEVVGISAASQTVEFRDVATGTVTTEAYDSLVLSPGAASIRPPLPGIDLPGIFQVRTVPDARQIREWIERGTSFLAGMEHYSGFQTVRPRRRAVVVGGGFIGLETAENLVHRGFDVTVIEMADQVLAPLDEEYGRLVSDFLGLHGVEVVLGDGVAGFEQGDDETVVVSTMAGRSFQADVVILALGVRPDTTLAEAAGIEIGDLGGIRVDDQMRTSDPHIFAVGDVIEVRDFVTGEWSLIALAGPANRQGRIAAEVIAGRDSRFRGTQGTAVVGLFGSTVAWTGVNEKTLRRLGDSDYEKVYLYPNSHAGYYPGAKPIAMKVLFRASDGRVLGAQAVGEDGVDKRVSHLALAVQLGATVYDLEEVELCYSPPFGSAKDPINFAGMVAAGVLRGDMPVSHWGGDDDAFILDVRDGPELAVEQVPGALNIPLGQLRDRLGELPTGRQIHVLCRSGQRAYYATRILLQHGFDAKVRSGGMLSHAILAAAGSEPAAATDSGAGVKAVTVQPGVANSVRYGEVPEPDPSTGSILVEAVAVGVCGTDVEIASGAYGWAPPGHDRLILGHESLGRVVDAGDSHSVQPGDLVVGIVRRPDPVPCGNCAVGEWDMCRNGQYTERGIKEIDGFMSQRWRIEPGFFTKLDPSLGILGVLLEPTTVVAKAWELVGAMRARAFWEPRHVLVTGAGPIGMLAALVGVQHGFVVHVLDRVTAGAKPQLVQDLGATYHAGAVADLAFEPDVIIECTGVGPVIVDSIRKVGAGGVVCLTGVGSGGPTSGLSPADVAREVVLHNNVIVGSVNANRRHFYRAAEALAAADRDWLARLITRRVSPEHIADALTRGPDDIKVVVDFGA